MNCTSSTRLLLAILATSLIGGCGGQSAPPQTAKPSTPVVNSAPKTEAPKQEEAPKEATTAVSAKADQAKPAEGNDEAAKLEAAYAKLGTLKGKFVVVGKIPVLTPKKCGGAVPGNCCKDAGNAPEERIIVGTNQEIANVFVYVRTKPKSIDPLVEKAVAAISPIIDNSNCQFKPHATFLYVKQKLSVTNTDTAGHNFKLDLPGTGINSMNVPGAPPTVFTVNENSAGKKPKEFSCSIHTWMNGWIQINDNPFGAVSKADGTFEIKGIPNEELEFQVWHEQMGFVRKATFKDGGTDDTGRFKKKLAAGETDLGTISIPAALIEP